MITLVSLFRRQPSSSIYSQNILSASKKFPDWRNLTVLGLVYIHVGIVPFREPLWSLYTGIIASPNAGSISDFSVSWCCPAPSAIRLHSAIFSNLSPFNWIFTFGKRKTLERKFLSSLARPCRAQNVDFCFWSSFNRWGTNFAAVCFVFKYAVWMHWRRTLTDVGDLLRLSSWMTWRSFFHIFITLTDLT
jgi:hypothetical protein